MSSENVNIDIEAFKQSLMPGQFFNDLFNVIPGVYYFVKNKEGKFVAGSPGFADLMGAASVDELLGKTDHHFCPDFLADAFREDDEKVFESGKPVYDQIELVPRTNGALDWLCTTKTPLIGNDGGVVGLAGIARLIQDSDVVYASHPEMKVIVKYLREHYSEKISMAEVAKHADISVSKQERLFKKVFGITPLMYLHKIRLNAACSMLRDTDDDLAKIAVDCGFNDQTNMTRAFRLELKITPLKYRKKFGSIEVSRAESGNLFPKV